jgi:ribosome modulation factor
MGTPVKHDLEAWQRGFADGERGVPKNRCPYAAATPQGFSWWSGWIEGDAKRQGYDVAKRSAA